MEATSHAQVPVPQARCGARARSHTRNHQDGQPPRTATTMDIARRVRAGSNLQERTPGARDQVFNGGQHGDDEDGIAHPTRNGKMVSPPARVSPCGQPPARTCSVELGTSAGAERLAHINAARCVGEHSGTIAPARDFTCHEPPPSVRPIAVSARSGPGQRWPLPHILRLAAIAIEDAAAQVRRPVRRQGPGSRVTRTLQKRQIADPLHVRAQHQGSRRPSASRPSSKRKSLPSP